MRSISLLLSSGAARENLREKGQFWTPDWVAEAMVEYVSADKDGMLFDPAVGAGAFFRAAKVIAKEKISITPLQEWILKRKIQWESVNWRALIGER